MINIIRNKIHENFPSPRYHPEFVQLRAELDEIRSSVELDFAILDLFPRFGEVINSTNDVSE